MSVFSFAFALLLVAKFVSFGAITWTPVVILGIIAFVYWVISIGVKLYFKDIMVERYFNLVLKLINKKFESAIEAAKVMCLKDFLKGFDKDDSEKGDGETPSESTGAEPVTEPKSTVSEETTVKMQSANLDRKSTAETKERVKPAVGAKKKTKAAPIKE